MKRIRSVRTLIAVAVLGVTSVLSPAIGSAQDLSTNLLPAPDAVVDVGARAPVGPVNAPAGIRNVVQVASPMDAAPPKFQEMGNGRNIALMLVGGAGIIVGSIVGGDGGQIITITGAVIGLVGLYRFLR